LPILLIDIFSISTSLISLRKFSTLAYAILYGQPCKLSEYKPKDITPFSIDLIIALLFLSISLIQKSWFISHSLFLHELPLVNGKHPGIFSDFESISSFL